MGPAPAVRVAHNQSRRLGPPSSPAAATPPPYARRNALAIAAATLAVLIVGAILTIRLSQGTIVVEGPDGGDLPADIAIVLQGGGKQLEITSADKWKLSVQPGTYEVQIKGGDDTFEIRDQEINVKRLGKQIIRVARQQAAADVAAPRPSEEQSAPSNSVAMKDLSGTWTIKEAENLLGEAYRGDVKIRQNSEGVVDLQWLDDQGRPVQTGLGLIEGDRLFAAWGVIPSYGFCLYKLGPDGTMEARWTMTGAGGRLAKETASGNKPGKLEGAYNILGSPIGQNGQYRGTLAVTKIDDTYAVEWDLAEGKMPGVGLRHGDWLAIGWSLQKGGGFGIVEYKLAGDTLNGRWGMIGSNELSFEILERAGEH